VILNDYETVLNDIGHILSIIGLMLQERPVSDVFYP